MDILIGLLSLIIIILTIALIIGLIKPNWVLRWDKNPTRLKVFLYWIGGIILFSFAESSLTDNNKVNFNVGKKFMDETRYELAISSLNKVESDHYKYSESQQLIISADSLWNIQKQKVRDELEASQAKKREEDKVKFSETLERELKSDVFKKGINKESYSGTMASLQLEIALFSVWTKMVEDSKKYDDNEIKQMGNKLKSKVERLQVKEFPRLRKEYGKILKEKLWEENIEVKTKRSSHSTLDFTGTLFANNKNIKTFEETISEGLYIFRFKRVQYRWIKHADEYTYYELSSPKDKELKSKIN